MIRTADEVMQQRGSQYGDFLTNMKCVKLLRSHIFENPYITDKAQKNDLARSTLDFTKTLLALKAARSLNASGDSFEDCLVDFRNYIVLARNALVQLGLITPDFKIFTFDVRYFNAELNEKLDVKSLAYKNSIMEAIK